MEKIAIDGFAGLKNVELEIAPITVFIGPQATGKSIIAKLLYFFREIASRLSLAVAQESSPKDYFGERKERFKQYFPPSAWQGKAFRITYTSRGKELLVASSRGSGNEIELWNDRSYSEILTRFVARKREFTPGTNEDDLDSTDPPPDYWQRGLYAALDRAVGIWGKFEQVFIPAGRAFFSQVQASVFTQLEAGGSVDPFLTAFGSLLERSKRILEEKGFFAPHLGGVRRGKRLKYQALKASFEKILRADLVLQGEGLFVRSPDARLVEFAQASSGQQEVLPLLLLLARFASLSHARGRSVYVEEPEAHLFPISQRHVVELIAETYRARADQMRLVITTHSPYILTSINNLLQAGQRFEEADSSLRERIEAIIPESRSILPGQVTAFALDQGSAQSILDPETNLIDAGMIDSVSTDLAVEFDQLLEAE